MDTSLADDSGAHSTSRICYYSGYFNYRGSFHAVLDLYYCVMDTSLFMQKLI